MTENVNLSPQLYVIINYNDKNHETGTTLTNKLIPKQLWVTLTSF